MAKITFRIDPKDAIRPLKVLDLNITNATRNILIGNFLNIQPFNEDEIEKQSLLNTPIYDSITFGNLTEPEKNNYIDLDGTERNFKPLQIDLVIITISQSKNIVSTAIQGRNGTVKEFISDGDYHINISGMININDNIYPEETVQTLINILKIPDQITVYSKFINMFGIHNIVVTDYDMPQQEGMRNQQPFTINALSDTTIDLEVLE